MSIELRCEKCGHHLRAPREATGRKSKCPNCNSELYIPTPEDELEELPLAPEDESELEREARLQAERRRLERDIAHDDKSGSAPTNAGTPSRPTRPVPPPTGSGRTSIRGAIMSYLAAMRDTDLDRADQAAALLATRRNEALRAIDQLAADQLPPPEMAKVPPGVYQGFLKNLRARL